MPSIKSFLGSRQNISLDDITELIQITTTKDSLGQAIKEEKKFMVFCTKLSVSRAEFSLAGQIGHKPDMMLLVDSDSYDNEKFLNYHGKKYSIYKSYQRPDHFTEVYCEVKSGD
jgi:SPP1 family predicted phage head-tail adaptor